MDGSGACDTGVVPSPGKRAGTGVDGGRKNHDVRRPAEPPFLPCWHKRRGWRPDARLRDTLRPCPRRRNRRNHRLAAHSPRQLGRDPGRSRRDGPGHPDRSRHAGCRRTGMRLGERPHRISSRRARICGATRSGATCRPAPAARSRPRNFICGRPAPSPVNCWSPPPRRAGKSRSSNVSPSRARSPTRRAAAACHSAPSPKPPPGSSRPRRSS